MKTTKVAVISSRLDASKSVTRFGDGRLGEYVVVSVEWPDEVAIQPTGRGCMAHDAHVYPFGLGDGHVCPCRRIEVWPRETPEKAMDEWARQHSRSRTWQESAR